jgi:hypothetical protein
MFVKISLFELHVIENVYDMLFIIRFVHKTVCEIIVRQSLIYTL